MSILVRVATVFAIAFMLTGGALAGNKGGHKQSLSDLSAKQQLQLQSLNNSFKRSTQASSSSGEQASSAPGQVRR